MMDDDDGVNNNQFFYSREREMGREVRCVLCAVISLQNFESVPYDGMYKATKRTYVPTVHIMFAPFSLNRFDVTL